MVQLKANLIRPHANIVMILSESKRWARIFISLLTIIMTGQHKKLLYQESVSKELKFKYFLKLVTSNKFGNNKIWYGIWIIIFNIHSFLYMRIKISPIAFNYLQRWIRQDLHFSCWWHYWWCSCEECWWEETVWPHWLCCCWCWELQSWCDLEHVSWSRSSLQQEINLQQPRRGQSGGWNEQKVSASQSSHLGQINSGEHWTKLQRVRFLNKIFKFVF